VVLRPPAVRADIWRVTWNSRLCRDCDTRFAPTRIDQRLCEGCASQTDELRKLLSYLRAHPEDPVTRVSVATGVSEDAISALALEGRLPVVPRGAEPRQTCTCDGGSRCPVCKAEVARRIVRATGLPGDTAPPGRLRLPGGMGTRRPDAR
jgi:hypothetical protein